MANLDNSVILKEIENIFSRKCSVICFCYLFCDLVADLNRTLRKDKTLCGRTKYFPVAHDFKQLHIFEINSFRLSCLVFYLFR